LDDRKGIRPVQNHSPYGFFSKEDPWGQALAGVISRKIGRVNKEKPKQ